MKQEYTLVKGKYNKMVTSAMSPSHHLSMQRENSISFFLIHSCSTNYVAISIIIIIYSHCLFTHTQS